MSESSSVEKVEADYAASTPGHNDKTVAGTTVDVAAHAIAGKEIDFTPEQAARVRYVVFRRYIRVH